MPREIWNEGRVQGLSSYEIYVKQHLSEDPNTPPATEREWLASSIAMGSSMILKVPNVDQGAKEHSFLDIFLPKDSKLAAANTIVAQFFDGECEFGESQWATRVTDYGQLISNTAESSPSGEIGSEGVVPAQDLSDWTFEQKNKLKEYLRIYDGIVIQPGTWIDSEVKPPEKDFQANLGSVYARVRLHIRGKIENNPYILLTGFTIRSVLAGVVGQDTVTESDSPQDGDFLGPAVFPWSSKIVFVVPNSYITYFDGGGYDRTIEAPTSEGESQTKLIQDTAVIDMQATKPESYYADDVYLDNMSQFINTENVSTNPKYPYTVNEFLTLGDPPEDGEAVLTVYQKKDIYPPAMYGTFVGEEGEHYLNPLDVVAPGTIKMFYNKSEEDLQNYEDTFPGTTGMNKTSEGTIQILNDNRKIVDVAGLSVQDMEVASPREDTTVKVLQVTTGQKSGWALAMSDMISNGLDEEGIPIPPDPLTITTNPTENGVVVLNHTNSTDNINWAALLDALGNDYGLDLLGDRLKNAKYTLQKPITGSAAEGSTVDDQRDTSQGSAYVEFGPADSPIRLYIATEAPDATNVPEGSIGIGWGLDY